MQLCKIVARQRFTKTLSSKQRTAQIAACKQGPQERQKICENVSLSKRVFGDVLCFFREISNELTAVFHQHAMEISKYNSDKLISEFGLQFDSKLAAVSGRILPVPKVSIHAIILLHRSFHVMHRNIWLRKNTLDC